MNKAALLSCALLSSHLYASDVDPFNLSLEEILSVKVEVATLSQEDEKNIPASVSVITEKEWERFGAQRGSDVLDRMTSMTTSPFLGSYILGLRGFNSTSSFRKVAYVLDGVSLNTFFDGTSQVGSGNFPDLYLLERIEVARGAISNVYGSSAMLGAVSMKTWSPKKDTVESRISTGSFGYDSFGVRLSKAIGNDFRLSLAASQSDVDDEKGKSVYKNSSAETKEAEYKNAWSKKSVLLKLEKSKHSFQVLHSQLSHFDQPTFELTNSYDPRSFDSAPNRFTLIKLTNNFSFGEYGLKAITHFKEMDTHFSSTTVGEGLPNGSETVSTTKAREQSYGVDLLFTPNSKKWFLGTEYYGSKVPYRRGSLGTLGKEVSPIGSEGAKRYQLSVKGNVQYPLMGEDFNLHVGGRVDKFSDDGTRFSPRAALIYSQSKDLTYKLVYSNAYRVPDLGVRAGTTSFFVLPNDNLDPEEFESIELITLYKKSNLKAQLSLYRNELKDEIVTKTTTAPNSQANNSRDDISHGIEGEFRMSKKNWVYELNADYSLSRAEATFPKLMLKWSLGYELDNIFTSLYGKNYFNYNTSQELINKFTGRSVSRYFDLGLNVGYSFKRWNSSHLLSLDVKNILNRENVAPYHASRENGLIEHGLGLFGSYKFKY